MAKHPTSKILNLGVWSSMTIQEKLQRSLMKVKLVQKKKHITSTLGNEYVHI